MNYRFKGIPHLTLLNLLPIQIVSNGRVALENVIKYGVLITPSHWVSARIKNIG